jgi:hypothetical protein
MIPKSRNSTLTQTPRTEIKRTRGKSRSARRIYFSRTSQSAALRKSRPTSWKTKRLKSDTTLAQLTTPPSTTNT